MALISVGWVGGAAGQSAQPDQARSPSKLYQVGVGGGVAGTVGSCEAGGSCREIKPTIAVQVQLERPIEGAPVSYGLHFDLAVSNFGVVKDVYSELDDCRGRDCLYLGAFGWLAGTSVLGTGPQLTVGRRDGSRPWASVGSSVILYIDPHGDDPGANDDRVIFAHGGWAALGYSIGSLGLGLRGFWAPKNGILFASDGAAVMSVLGTLEITTLR